ncbi:hypothetical protein EAC14_13575 [Enterococcus faecium]|nr:hypothetical protein [Enterococcus faecium]
MKPKNAFIILGSLFVIGVGGALYNSGVFNSNENNTESEEMRTENFDVRSDLLAASKHIDIENISKDMIGEEVVVSGIVALLNKTEAGHVFIDLEDNTGSILIPIFSTTDISVEEISKGDQLEVKGEVDLYNGKLEVIPSEASSVITREAHPLKSEIGNIVEISGTIVNKNSTDGHVFITLKSEDGYETLIPLFNNLSPESFELNENEQISVKGKVQLYEEQIEIIPNSMSDVHLLSERKSNNNYINVQEITSSNVGEEVVIKGKISDIYTSNSDNVFFELSDNTGSIKSVMFSNYNNKYEARKSLLEKAGDNESLNLVVEGEINIYKGDLQVIVNKVWSE